MWNNISAEVGRLLFDEFGSLYQGGLEGRAFQDFLSSGRYTNLGEDFGGSVQPTPSVSGSPVTVFGTPPAETEEALDSDTLGLEQSVKEYAAYFRSK
ncbi:MAG: hypothetical protein ACOYKA_00325 [Legionellaceae bacterium]